MKDQLLPCPFCGSNDVEISSFNSACYVQCCTCLCQGPEQVEEEIAVNDWNNRVVVQQHPVKQPEKNRPDVPNTWLSVAGEEFACSCGCKLFHQHNNNVPDYHCNACGTVYEGMV